MPPTNGRLSIPAIGRNTNVNSATKSFLKNRTWRTTYQFTTSWSHIPASTVTRRSDKEGTKSTMKPTFTRLRCTLISWVTSRNPRTFSRPSSTSAPSYMGGRKPRCRPAWTISTRKKNLPRDKARRCSCGSRTWVPQERAESPRLKLVARLVSTMLHLVS